MSVPFMAYAGATNFKPDCTVPPLGTDFVSGPGVRGTMSIFWNCLSIFILCTWSIQHLNIPAERRPSEGFMRKPLDKLLGLLIRLKWMAIIILFPEFLVGKGLIDRVSSEDVTKEFACDKIKDANWTPLHHRMANMGYFVIDFSRLLKKDKNFKTKFDSDVREVIDDLKGSARVNAERLSRYAWALNTAQWHVIARNNLATLPSIDEKRLEALNRGDPMTKLLAVVQAGYLIVQLIVRRVKGLPSTQLEVAALAFAVTSLITYLLFWSQPQNVNDRHITFAENLPTKDVIKTIAHWGPTYVWVKHRESIRIDHNLDLDSDSDSISLPNDGTNLHCGSTFVKNQATRNWISAYGNEIFPMAMGTIIGGTLFGALHCIAWFYAFPTPVEAVLWRVSSVATTLLPLLSVPVVAFWMHLIQGGYGKNIALTDEIDTETNVDNEAKLGNSTALVASIDAENPSAVFQMDDDSDFNLGMILDEMVAQDYEEKRREEAIRIVGWVMVLAFVLPYTVARIYIIVEMIRSLFYLPPEAFVETWSASFPHW